MKWVVYSHTDYLDVLRVQSIYNSDLSDKVLLINSVEGVPEEILSGYHQVILYDDKLPYASRLLALKVLSDDYIGFTHDMDIVFEKNDEKMKEMERTIREADWDRIDLKPAEGGSAPFQRIDDVLMYPYNVNPALWKMSTFMKIMETFSGETYRTIESLYVQHYCKQFKVYRPYSATMVNCGYFRCLPWFQFLHITHHGQFMPLSPPGIDEKALLEYESVCKNYLDTSPRGYKETMW